MGNRGTKNRKRNTRAKNGLSFKYSVEASICRISTDDESRNSWIKNKEWERERLKKEESQNKKNEQLDSKQFLFIDKSL